MLGYAAQGLEGRVPCTAQYILLASRRESVKAFILFCHWQEAEDVQEAESERQHGIAFWDGTCAEEAEEKIEECGQGFLILREQQDEFNALLQA